MYRHNPERYSPTRSATPRQPLRNCTELAEEFGVTPAALGGMLSKDPKAPRLRLKAGPHKYYEPEAMRAWWAARKAAV